MHANLELLVIIEVAIISDQETNLIEKFLNIKLSVGRRRGLYLAASLSLAA